MDKIYLQSSDGEVIEADRDIIKLSSMLNLFQDSTTGGSLAEPIPFQNVNAAILKKVVEWCSYHKNDPKEQTSNRTDNIAAWDVEFLKVDQGTLFELILAANYMDIKGLLDVTCKTVANMIKGRSPEEIRRIFNTKNFTPEEEEQIRKENAWCDD